MISIFKVQPRTEGSKGRKLGLGDGSVSKVIHKCKSPSVAPTPIKSLA